MAVVGGCLGECEDVVGCEGLTSSLACFLFFFCGDLKSEVKKDNPLFFGVDSWSDLVFFDFLLLLL